MKIKNVTQVGKSQLNTWMTKEWSTLCIRLWKYLYLVFDTLDVGFRCIGLFILLFGNLYLIYLIFGSFYFSGIW